ncbi:MAG TPA: zinc-binding dehydrogenase [Polyangiales bacterium]|nr:zinc-binding dehydrogenase [Polyangiales bacterium]
MTTRTETGLELRSTVKSNNTLELTLEEQSIPALKPEEVLIRVEAAPINPSDLALLFGMADMGSARVSGTRERPVVTADISPAMVPMVAARLDRSLPVGNEGSGVVIEAGSSASAQALVGKVVAMVGGAMYAQYRRANADQCLALPAGTTPRDAASCFVNPLTALGMVETMKLEGHSALVHTAAASNLGQMLNKLCKADGVALVNVVRRPEQVQLLRELGAEHVFDSSSSTFRKDLVEALATTGATIAFDAIGGGELGSQILGAMELAASRKGGEYSRYGSTVHKQLYIYGGLDRSPTVLRRAFGFAWGIGGWLLTPFLMKIGAAGAQRLRERVAAEIKTTFASHYAKSGTLQEALSLDAIAMYAKQSTGEKFLVTPHG